MESISNIFCPDYKKNKKEISKINLFHQIINRQTEEIGKSIKTNLESKAADFKFSALATD